MMRKNSERTYWMTDKNWYRVNEEKDCFELTDEAHPRARESFALWNKPEKRTPREWWRLIKSYTFATMDWLDPEVRRRRKRSREIQKQVDEHIKQVKLYEPSPSLNIDLRGLSRYCRENNLKGSELPEEVLDMFRIKDKKQKDEVTF